MLLLFWSERPLFHLEPTQKKCTSYLVFLWVIELTLEMSFFVQVSIYSNLYSNPFGVEYPKIRTVVLKEIYLGSKDPTQQWEAFFQKRLPAQNGPSEIPRMIFFGNEFERWKEMKRMGMLAIIHTTFEWGLVNYTKYSMIRLTWLHIGSCLHQHYLVPPLRRASQNNLQKNAFRAHGKREKIWEKNKKHMKNWLALSREWGNESPS